MGETLNKTLIVIVSILVVLAITNIIIQASNLDLEIPEDFHKPHIQSNNPNLFHELKKNYDGEWLGHETKTNSLGFRDEERTLDKNGKTRIFIIGDSVTFGFKRNQNEAYPHLLEQKLNEKTDKYEVWNMGVSGYGTYEELYLLKEYLDYKPDLVILAYFQNDITQPPAFVFDKQAFFENHKLASKIEKTKLRNIEFYKLIMKNIYVKEKKASIKEYEKKIINMDDNINAMSEIVELLKQENIDLLILNIPYLFENQPYPKSEQIPINNVRGKAEVIDILPYYQKEPNWFQNLRASNTDTSHVNIKGHRLIAEAIYDYLQ